MAVKPVEIVVPNVSQVSDIAVASELNKIYVQLRKITSALNDVIKEVNSGTKDGTN